MQGLGKPGANFVKMLEWSFVYDDLKASPMPTPIINPRVNARTAKPAQWLAKWTQFIPKCLIHDALNNPPISWYGNSTFTTTGPDQFNKYTYPREGCSEVHMVFTDTPCWTTCWNDSNSFIKALLSPKIEFVLVKHPWMENDCNFADILLPVNTKFEEEDIAWDVESGQYHTVFHEAKAVEPYGESYSDYEITCMLAERFGLLKEYSGGKTIEDNVKEYFEAFGLGKMVSFKEFKENGYFVIPTDPKWSDQPAGLRLFHDDPVKNPLKTPTGKLEFVSTNLKKHFPDDIERPPMPHWIEKGQSHDERTSSSRARKYPLLMMSNHGRWRVHANMDDLTWIREIQTCKVQGPDGYKYEPLWINPKDAAARGIQTGDIVSTFNERGIVLAGAYVTERMKPGVVYMDHGARLDPIDPGKIDRGGAINTITPHNNTSKNAVGMATSGFLVEVNKADMDELRQKYPEAFKRPYDPGAGLRMEGRMART
jgi:trimethylamine-N-oxide reductase (cytochrome c)